MNAITPHSLHDDLAFTYTHHRHELVRALARRHPHLCRGRLEDAVGAAFLQAFERPRAFEQAASRGPEALRRFFHLVARRQLRTETKRKCEQAEQAMSDQPVLGGHETTPEAEAIAQELAARLDTLLDEASHRYGRGQKPELRRALEARLTEGGTDTAHARAHGVRREYLLRARHWLTAQMVPSADHG